jgi:hypothetical protein
MMEKKGVVDEDTPGCNPQGCGCQQAIKKLEEPLTKEGADAIQSHQVNDMIDAVAEQTAKNRG